MTPNDPKNKNGSTGQNPKANGNSPNLPDNKRRIVKKQPKSEERFTLEQLEGEDFDSADFKFLTDWSDDIQ